MPKPMHILVADDDPLVTQLLSTGLRSRGWRVTVAADTMQAVMFAVRTPPDAVLLDIRMPGGAGTLVLSRLRASQRTSRVPVIVLSGVSDPEVVSSVLSLGAERFLNKPVDLDVVDAALREVLELAEG
jgi:DNA-binding response OmpR family regulator